MTTFEPLDPYFATFNVTYDELLKAKEKFEEKYGVGSYDRLIKKYEDAGIMSIFQVKKTEEKNFFVTECVTPIVNERMGLIRAEKERKERAETPVHTAAEYAALQAERDAAVKLAEANAEEVKRLRAAMKNAYLQNSVDPEDTSLCDDILARALGHKIGCFSLAESPGNCDCGGIETT